MEVAVIFVGYVPRSGIAGSKGRDISSFGSTINFPKWMCCFILHESSHGGRVLSPFNIAGALTSAVLVGV